MLCETLQSVVCSAELDLSWICAQKRPKGWRLEQELAFKQTHSSMGSRLEADRENTFWQPSRTCWPQTATAALLLDIRVEHRAVLDHLSSHYRQNWYFNVSSINHFNNHDYSIQGNQINHYDFAIVWTECEVTSSSSTSQLWPGDPLSSRLQLQPQSNTPDPADRGAQGH